MRARSPTRIWPFSSTVGTGTTSANSLGSPLKSLAIVMTVLSSLRTRTTFDAWLKSRVSAFAT